jgi:hypothetical protein
MAPWPDMAEIRLNCAPQTEPMAQITNFSRSFCNQPSKRLWLLAVAALLLTICSASARTRDDVINGMFRCAAIGDTRIWLDCYYGAAQPQRLALGMIPASPAQVRLAQNPPASAPTGDPNPRYQATAEALRCNGVADERQWLNCYYAAAGPVRAQLGLPPAPQTAPLIPGNAPMIASIQPGRQPAPATLLPAGWVQMSSYNFDRNGIFTVVLANGQHWQQLSGDTDLAHWKKPAASYQVRITHGALHSVNLKIKGEAANYKVEQAE